MRLHRVMLSIIEASDVSVHEVRNPMLAHVAVCAASKQRSMLKGDEQRMRSFAQTPSMEKTGAQRAKIEAPADLP